MDDGLEDHSTTDAGTELSGYQSRMVKEKRLNPDVGNARQSMLKLVMQNYVAQCGFKDFSVNVIKDSEQVLHLDVISQQFQTTFLIFAVYAKFTRRDSQLLWDELEGFYTQHIGEAWMVGGDFNVFRSLEEYSRNGHPDQAAIKDFNECINKCNLAKTQTIGSTIQHLNRASSDPSPLLHQFEIDIETRPRLFRRLKLQLKDWNQTTSRDVFQNLRAAEEEVWLKELQYDSTNAINDRMELHRAQAYLFQRLREHEDFIRQKSKIK
ncbi:OLC1v1018854C1 [Oldenlandia corymbosa var. corymbosa]|uniref:OLC1v1018854C1 n=1 Tax=Oldenlandia corymbosa var. corymbosa TaxID=529605 RepID=A0AAV1ECJ4_OLDCO|nr:OLC1v1018854C1 [Oldenlandia corymbosa var. corymbosa]